MNDRLREAALPTPSQSEEGATPPEEQRFTYTLTEEGDLLFSGGMPDYPHPSATPWYAERERIRRVVAEAGSRVGAHAFAELPELLIADLTGVAELGEDAFADCTALKALVLSPVLRHPRASVFGGCGRLLLVDYAGSLEELEALLVSAKLPLSGLILRTAPTPSDELIASGEVGKGTWALDNCGLLTVKGAEIPDYRSPQEAPWFPYRQKINSLLISEDVTRVGERSFFGMASLTSVTLAGRAKIGNSAFATCTGLTTLNVFGSVTEIGLNAFAGTGLVTAIMPPSLRRIPAGLYDSCRNLTTLVLPIVGIEAFAPFTEGCRRGLRLKMLAERTEYRALRKQGFRHAGRARFYPTAPELKELHRLIGAAEEAGNAAAVGLSAATSAIDAAIAAIDPITDLVTEAEEAYLTAETRRTGFGERFDGGRELNLRRLERAKKEWEKESRKEAAEEVHREQETVKAAEAGIRTLKATLADAIRSINTYESQAALARRRANAALRAAKALYPYATAERERAAALAEYAASIPAIPRTAAMKYAAVRMQSYHSLFHYRRYDDVRAGMEELIRVMTGVKEETDEKIKEDAIRPRILIAGGDPLDDRATAVCVDAIRRAGAIAVIAPLTRPAPDADRGFDGLLICGEGAVDPVLYNERRKSIWDRRGTASRTPLEVARDARDYDLVNAFYLYGKPILGLNRGCQLINVTKGGTLYRELSEKRIGSHFDERHPVLHEITIDPTSFLYSIYKPTVRPVRVSSFHRGGIRELGRDLIPIARSEDGLVEAFAHTSLPVAGIQFSVERMLHATTGLYSPTLTAPDNGKPIFTWYLDLCRKIRKSPLTRLASDRFSEDEEA